MSDNCIQCFPNGTPCIPRLDSQGYAVIYAPGSPLATTSGEVRQHQIVVFHAMGHRRLPVKAQIHHFNETRNDNAGTNLVVCEDSTYHKLLHTRQAVVALGFKASVVHTVGGVDYEGWPTSETNYLQRLRILVAKEDSLEKFVAKVREDLTWIATVNESIALQKLDAKTLVGMIFELRGRAKDALRELD